jgi:hypothetical protein
LFLSESSLAEKSTLDNAYSSVTLYKNGIYDLLETPGGGDTSIGINRYMNHSKRLGVVLEVS